MEWSATINWSVPTPPLQKEQYKTNQNTVALQLVWWAGDAPLFPKACPPPKSYTVETFYFTQLYTYSRCTAYCSCIASVSVRVPPRKRSVENWTKRCCFGPLKVLFIQKWDRIKRNITQFQVLSIFSDYYTPAENIKRPPLRVVFSKICTRLEQKHTH